MLVVVVAMVATPFKFHQFQRKIQPYDCSPFLSMEELRTFSEASQEPSQDPSQDLS